MSYRLPSIRSLAAFLHFTAGVIVIAMLFAFPATRNHDFATHFRTPEARRSMQRHIVTAHTRDGASERVAQSKIQPAIFVAIDAETTIAPIEDIDSFSRAPLSWLLHRLKLSPAGSGGQDPLL